ncbi:MAG: GGDEF domain-containing protein [Vibrionaceae bacterium]|nr:GGDEF domain-containing protein [Vibrionaceae bacterium]
MRLKSVYISLFFSTLLFLMFLVSAGFYVISNELKQFHIYKHNIDGTKQKVIMLSLLTESEMERFKDNSIDEIEKTMELSFDDSVYSLNDDSQMDYFETVARKVMHETSVYLSTVFAIENVVLYYRSYTNNKYIFEHGFEANEFSNKLFSDQWCKQHQSCTALAWREQLKDKVLISYPFENDTHDKKYYLVLSPVYYQGKLVGEFGIMQTFTGLYEQGRDVRIELEGGYKNSIIYHRNYLFDMFSYSKSYAVDNTNLITYQYPFMKLVVDYFFVYIVLFVAILAYYIKSEESKKSKNQLTTALFNAKKDELTKLYNRKVFKDETFIRVLKSAPYTVLAIDGNRIKRINDTYGHHVGDEVIVMIAESMRKVFRSSDYLVRTGGDEFVAVLSGCSTSNATMLAEKLKRAVSKRRLANIDTELSVSVGIASSGEGESLKDVIIRADESLYEAKKQRD